MATIKDLQPKIVWDNFYGITRQPRPSKHEEKIRAWLLDWGKTHGVETFVDDTGNVIMRVGATPGYEGRKGVILQGHMDMVPQKNADVRHDFLTDPIETRVDGDWIRAKGTTLGADDGLGVALALSAIQDPSVKHGPIEVLITYDEETGMTGAASLKPGVLHGDILINLDSETEGEFYVGCAGGLDSSADSAYKEQPAPAGWECWTLNVKGCQGGHSGMDIILCRANANRLAARLIHALLTRTDAELSAMEGGTLRNAIPRECFSTLFIRDARQAQAVVDEVTAEIKAEYAATDPDLEVEFRPCSDAEAGSQCVPHDTALTYVRTILACPDGVERMSDSMPGMVETSNNMAMVKVAHGTFFVKTLLRSSVDSAKHALATRIESVFALAGIPTAFTGEYSGWAPNPDSEILAVMRDTYTKMFGQEPKVMAIHAGLECGILSGAYPHWDMVSIGPTLKSPHSPDERAYIPSVGKVWEFLKAVLAAVPAK